MSKTEITMQDADSEYCHKTFVLFPRDMDFAHVILDWLTEPCRNEKWNFKEAPVATPTAADFYPVILMFSDPRVQTLFHITWQDRVEMYYVEV